jgi:MFS superfamily sulfate permease-like transporter
MSTWPRHPVIYEINTCVWVDDLSRKHQRSVNLATVPPEEWDQIASGGFDAVWFMGVWERSPVGIEIYMQNQVLLEDFRRAIPGFVAEDNIGSPSDMERNPDNVAIPGALLFRIESALLYFNVTHVHDAVWQGIRAGTGPLTLVVCDLSTSPMVDLAGARMLAKLHEELPAAGIRLQLVAAHAVVRDILRTESLEERVGYFGRRITVADAIDELQGRTGTADKPNP